MTKEHGISDHRCGFELSLRKVRDWKDDSDKWSKTTEVVRCCRETWNNTEHCIWHAEIKNKPVEELKAARTDDPEQLHGAYLVGVLAANHLSFQGCGLRHAVFSHGRFLSTEFHDVDLLGAKFHNADLFSAEFYDADLYSTEFHDADLLAARFHDAALFKAEFHNADLHSTEFQNADLSRTEFRNGYIYHGNFTDANVKNADFTQATLHDALFTRADCRGATFTDAFLYETVFENTRINSQTTFHDPTTSRPRVVYEKNPHTTDDLPKDIHPLEAAEWVYRRLEKIHEENALSERARNYHISKQEARRKYQRDSGEYARYVVSTLQWYVTGHGESIPRIFASAAVLILVSGILYPLVGGFESSSTGAAYRIPLTELHQVVSFDGVATILQGIYFSVITFTTIGYGDLYPTGVGSKLLVGFESLSGAILIALFVFVLGRRVAR